MVKEVRDRSGKCQDCVFLDRCCGGCRSATLIAGKDYYGIDPKLCKFFKNGWDKQICEVTQPVFEACLKCCPPSPGQDTETVDTNNLPLRLRANLYVAKEAAPLNMI